MSDRYGGVGTGVRAATGVGMVACSRCGADVASDSKFCAQCGAEVEGSGAVGGGATVVTDPPAAADPVVRPEAAMLAPPRRPLFRRPLTSDWVFWLFVVLAGIGGTQNAYRSGQGYGFSSPTITAVGGFIDVGVSLLIGFGMFALIPALLRALVRRVSDRRALVRRPEDASEGWKTDPLNSASERWWKGDGWTRAVKPERSKKVGSTAWWIFGGLLAVMTVAFLLGRSSDPAPDFSNVDVDALREQVQGDTRQFLDEPLNDSDSTGEANPNTALAVGTYFSALVESITAYSQTPVDIQDVEASMVDARAAFEDVETNYTLLSGALSQVTSQQELGPGAPDLGDMRAFVDAMGPYVQTRLDYYAALDECGPMTTTREWGDCELAAFDIWEKPMVDTIPPVQTAFETLLESAPQNP